MELKKPITFDEQIDMLKMHGMDVADIIFAREVLKTINYYRFTGYALQFRKKPNESRYVDGITFEQVYRIYKFDEVLRDILRRYIEKSEIYYRTQIAYGFSVVKCTTPPYEQHYDERNFFNKKGYNEVMDNFAKEKNYYKDSLVVKHHKEKYGRL